MMNKIIVTDSKGSLVQELKTFANSEGYQVKIFDISSDEKGTGTENSKVFPTVDALVYVLENNTSPVANELANELEELSGNIIHLNPKSNNYFNPLEEKFEITNEMLVQKMRDLMQINTFLELHIKPEIFLEMVCLENQLVLTHEDKIVILNKLI